MLIDLKPEQVEYLRRLLDSENDGAAEFMADVGYRHLDGDVNHAHDLLDVLDDPPQPTAYVAEIDGFDGLYLFQSEEDRDRFVRARFGMKWESAIEDGPVVLGDSPINDAQTAQHLISSEAAMRLEEEGWPSVAEDVREGLPSEVVLKRLREIGEGDSDAAEIIASAGLEEES